MLPKNLDMLTPMHQSSGTRHMICMHVGDGIARAELPPTPRNQLLHAWCLDVVVVLLNMTHVVQHL